jgi:hypothetical protein
MNFLGLEISIIVKNQRTCRVLALLGEYRRLVVARKSAKLHPKGTLDALPVIVNAYIDTLSKQCSQAGCLSYR